MSENFVVAVYADCLVFSEMEVAKTVAANRGRKVFFAIPYFRDIMYPLLNLNSDG